MQEQANPRPILNARQTQVLGLLAMGHVNKTIARELGIGTETVRRHIANARRALRAKTRTEAAVKAVRQGLI